MSRDNLSFTDNFCSMPVVQNKLKIETFLHAIPIILYLYVPTCPK